MLQTFNDDNERLKITLQELVTRVAKIKNAGADNTEKIAEINDTLVELETRKADIDGNYPDMIVGRADDLNASVYVTDTAPYTYRTAGGSNDIGNYKRLKKIVGGSIVWNQLFQPSVIREREVSGLTIEKTSNGEIWVHGTCESTNAYSLTNPIDTPVGHVFFLTGMKNSLTTALTLRASSPLQTGYGDLSVSANSNGTINLYITSGTEIDIKIKPSLIDVTQMLGPTISNYAYGLDSTARGAGIKWLRDYGFFDNLVYPYSAPKLEHVCTDLSADFMVNLYNSKTKTAYLVGGKKVRIEGAYTSLAYSTGEILTPDGNGEFTPTLNGTLTVTGGNSTTYVHLVWSGAYNGKFEKFNAQNYPIDPVVLMGVPTLNASNEIEFDGDTLEPDGTHTHKYGIVDLGTLEWNYNSGSAIFYTNGLASSIKLVGTGSIAKARCSKYITVSGTSQYDDEIDKSISVGYIFVSNGVNIKDTAYNDATAFKTAMDGVYLIYELATPTTEKATPYTEEQKVNDYGTECFRDALFEAGDRDFRMPTGHVSEYPPNLRDKEQHLPSLADADGIYLILQSGTQMYLTAYSPGIFVPQLPSEAGTYTLKTTIADGVGEAEWVLDE